MSSKLIPFTVSARTAILLGRENVTNSKSAIIELVKNTYDADSPFCLLYFSFNKNENYPNSLYIIDNGDGMNEEILSTLWMTIGTDNKKYDYITHNGRIKSGAKGIGRFALDRLGNKCDVYTKMNSDITNKWSVTWDAFESAGVTINNVNAKFLDLPNDRFTRLFNRIKKKIYTGIPKDTLEKLNLDTNIRNGTIIRISELRDNWTPNTILDIHRSLNTLIPPKNISDFGIYLFSSKELEKYGCVDGELADDYDYRISCEFASQNKLKLTLNRNEFDYSKFPDELLNCPEFLSDPSLSKSSFQDNSYVYYKSVNEIMKIKNPTTDLSSILNNFSCEINFLKRSQTKLISKTYFTKDISNQDRKKWLDVYGGIKLFRDNFKVRPYGEVESTGFDWLSLSLRTEKSPAAPSHPTGSWRVRASQIQGIVNISRLNTTLFQDQANREGIQDTTEFSFFKELLIKIVQEFETDRQKIYRLIREYSPDSQNKEETKRKGSKLAKSVTKNKTNANSDDNTLVLAETVTIVNEENEILKDEIRMLQALATTGLIINTLSHEIKDNRIKINKRITKSSDILTNEPMNQANWTLLTRHIDVINKSYKSLNEMFTMTLDVIKKDKRKRRSGYLKSFIKDIKDSWEEILAIRNIILNYEIGTEDEYRLKFFHSDLETILNNLIINSIEAFEDEEHQVDSRIINVFISSTDEEFIFTYTDNGPGLSSSITNDEVFQANESTKKNQSTGETIGTGLGMWIVKSIISEYKGSCELCRSNDGFKFVFTLKKNIKSKRR